MMGAAGGSFSSFARVGCLAPAPRFAGVSCCAEGAVVHVADLEPSPFLPLTAAKRERGPWRGCFQLRRARENVCVADGRRFRSPAAVTHYKGDTGPPLALLR